MNHPDSDIVLERLMSLHPKIIDLTLDRVLRLLAALDHPERRLPPVIHLAGTNGKGSTLAMIRAGLEGALDGGKPVWLAVTVDDEDGSRLRSGETVADLAPIVTKRASAILANCSAPEAMAAALALFRNFDLPFGAYANGFQEITKEFLKDTPTVAALHKRPEMTPALYADFALGWVDLGATIIGGCCETTPAHIAEIARRLAAAGHRVV